MIKLNYANNNTIDENKKGDEKGPPFIDLSYFVSTALLQARPKHYRLYGVF